MPTPLSIKGISLKVRLLMLAGALILTADLTACGVENLADMDQPQNQVDGNNTRTPLSGAAVPESAKSPLMNEELLQETKQGVGGPEQATSAESLLGNTGSTSHCVPGWICQAECYDGTSYWYDVGVCPAIEWGKCTNAARDFCAHWGWGLKGARWN